MSKTEAGVSRKSFKVTACIDWLDVVIETFRPSQHQHVQEVLRGITGTKLWVETLDKRAGNVGTAFRLRFHDLLANDYQKLRKTLDDFAIRYPIASAPRITAIEVACDFRHKTGSIPETLAMTHRLQSCLFAEGTKHRQFDPVTRENRYLDHHGDRLDPNLNFRIGNKADPFAWQVYYKKTDNQQLLPKDRWRARVEVTLQGSALHEYGINLLADLQFFQFDKLTGLFRFRREVAPEKQAGGDLFKLTAIKINRKLHDATPERGMHSFDKIGRRDKWRKTRAESRHIEADSELQGAVKGALRRLTL
ncbi:hypothetical protein I9018_07400 [Pseudomonas sp. MPFS]|uniref:hypothetical protein n=1 Tax=Pseudomonas sp. MPFS TaxID=2795724 RepID=UPI001F13D1C2|nr:hypothetical protein [Pseudomonas sp. MPFS]UMZ13516.1 hypothetical protein I9018_07400 [Pseudomonas sp. MPFS]